VGEAVGSAETVEAGLGLAEILGGIGSVLGPVATVLGIALVTAYLPPEDIAMGTGFGGFDFGFSADAGFTTGYDFDKSKEEKAAIKKKELDDQRIADLAAVDAAYTGKACYVLNYGYWWEGKIDSVEWGETESEYTLNLLKIIRNEPSRAVADMLYETYLQSERDLVLMFTVTYLLNRGQSDTIQTSDSRRIWLRDGRGQPPAYVSGNFIDDYISRFADENWTGEDEFTIQYRNDGAQIYTYIPMFEEIPPSGDVPDPVTPWNLPIIIEEPVKPIIPVDDPPPEEGDLEPVEETTYIAPPAETVQTVEITSEDQRIYPIAIYQDPAAYTSVIRTQLQYAVGTSAILMLLSII
jgi:hypothetical protein